MCGGKGQRRVGEMYVTGFGTEILITLGKSNEEYAIFWLSNQLVLKCYVHGKSVPLWGNTKW